MNKLSSNVPKLITAEHDQLGKYMSILSHTVTGLKTAEHDQWMIVYSLIALQHSVQEQCVIINSHIGPSDHAML